MSRPTVTVIMPAYNCEPYIRKAIDSILNQTYADFELVVCDDASTDATWDVINSYSDSRIRKFRNDANKGIVGTTNRLLDLAEGKMITCQDADDWSDKRRLEVQMNVFATHPDIFLCGINGDFYYSETVQRRCPPFNDGYVENTPGPFPFILPAILYRREVLDKVKGFHQYFDRTTSMDQYFIMDILAQFKSYAVNEYLYTARFNTSSNTRTFVKNRRLTAHEAYLLLKKQRLETGSDWLMEKREADLLEFEEKLLKDRKYMAEKYREYAVYRVESDKPWRFAPLILKSLLLNPFHTIAYRTLFFGLRKTLFRR